MKTRITLIFLITVLNLQCCKAVKLTNYEKLSETVTTKAYSNAEFGLSFQHPATWIKYGEETRISDNSGNTVLIEINFLDSVTKTTCQISYHLAPKGKDLYRYTEEQFNANQGWYESDKKEIYIAGQKALEGYAILKTDGRGNPINPMLKLILIDFLDFKKEGTYQIQFKTPLSDSEIEIAKLNQLLTTIKYINAEL